MKIIVDNEDEKAILQDFLGVLRSWLDADLVEGGQWKEFLEEGLENPTEEKIEELEEIYWEIVYKLVDTRNLQIKD